MYKIQRFGRYEELETWLEKNGTKISDVSIAFDTRTERGMRTIILVYRQQ